MLFGGIIVSIAGLIGEYAWYTKDWVYPITFTGTIIGIEDLIMGFFAGGAAIVLYKAIFNKDDYKANSLGFNSKVVWLVTSLLGLIVCDFLFRFFGVFSYYANLLGLGLIAVILLSYRKDLIKEALWGGLLLTAISLPVYWIWFAVFPGIRERYWQFDMISGSYFLGIPYEDVIWWFFVGVVISIAYDEYNGLRLRKVRSEV